MPRRLLLFTCIALPLVLATTALGKKGGGGEGEYLVTIFGALTAQPYIGVEGVGRSQPIANKGQVDPGLNWSFFFDKFGDNGEGENCFSNVRGGGLGTQLMISEEKDGDALARYWFRGHGKNGLSGPEIKYHVYIFGLPWDADWRPVSGQPSTAYFWNWEMRAENKKYTAIACEGDGFFNPDIEEMGITVERTN